MEKKNAKTKHNKKQKKKKHQQSTSARVTSDE